MVYTADYLSVKQKHNFGMAFRRILAFQNSDGSWGKEEYRISLTSQAIQLLISLGFSQDNKVLKRAIRWFDDNVLKGTPHWTSRIEIGLKIGWFERLYKESYISDFINELNHDLDNPHDSDTLNIFWDVLPTLIALFPYEEDYKKLHKKETGDELIFPHERVIEKLQKEFQIYGQEGFIAVGNKPNNTGLVALYFSVLSSRREFYKYKDTSNSMIKWLFAGRQIDDDDNDVYWADSQSITSYILIDLNRCVDKEDDIRNSFSNIIHYLSPNSRGLVREDKLTAFNTEMHKNPIYITILILRAIVDVIGKDNDNIISIKNAAYNIGLLQVFRYKLSYLYSMYRKRIPNILCVLFLGVSVILFLEKKSDTGQFILNIVCSVFFSMWFNDLRET